MREFRGRNFENKDRENEPVFPFRTVQLLGPREEQQDFFASKNYSKDGKKYQLHVVADGHGSGGEFYAERASEEMIERISGAEGELGEAEFEKIFYGVDEDLSDIVSLGGTTLSVAVLREREVRGAYVGDSEIKLLGSHGMFTDLTGTHRLDNKSEEQRVLEAGGVVRRGRIMNNKISGINISRAIGDRDFRPFVIPKPEFFRFDIHPSDKYLLIGSDGFWGAGYGFAEEKEFLGKMLAAAPTIERAKSVIDGFLSEAMHHDNITLQIIGLNEKK